MNIRRINRGIALGCVLAVGTVSYVVYDQKQFSKGQDSIKSIIEQYFNDVASVQVTKNQEKALDAYKNVMDKYWVNNNDWFNEDDFIFDKSSLTEGWDTIIKDWQPTGHFEKCEMRIGDVSINKYGNNGAVATVDYDVYCEYFGAPLDFSNVHVTTADQDYYVGNENGDKDESVKYKGTKNYFATEFYLENVDGDWRIVGVGRFSNGYSSNISNVTEENNDSKAVDDNMENSDTDSDSKAGGQNE